MPVDSFPPDDERRAPPLRSLRLILIGFGSLVALLLALLGLYQDTAPNLVVAPLGRAEDPNGILRFYVAITNHSRVAIDLAVGRARTNEGLDPNAPPPAPPPFQWQWGRNLQLPAREGTKVAVPLPAQDEPWQLAVTSRQRPGAFKRQFQNLLGYLGIRSSPPPFSHVLILPVEP